MRPAQELERYIRRRAIATTADMAAHLKLSRPALFRALSELVAEERVQRIGRGRYRLAAPNHETDTWVAAQHQYPQGVICLLSALMLHEITTQSPREIWLALPKSAWRKPAGYPPLRLVHLSGAAFTAGIETRERPAGVVRVYSAAKTVADCFKFRNQVGLDVALEALREGFRARRFTLDELDSMARVCRVQAVLRPYVEALVA
jgi:predicted transcriptional regulator of viral defense system